MMHIGSPGTPSLHKTVDAASKSRRRMIITSCPIPSLLNRGFMIKEDQKLRFLCPNFDELVGWFLSELREVH